MGGFCLLAEVHQEGSEQGYLFRAACFFLTDPGKARDCSTNPVVISSKTLFLLMALRCRQAQMIRSWSIFVTTTGPEAIFFKHQFLLINQNIFVKTNRICQEINVGGPLFYLFFLSFSSLEICFLNRNHLNQGSEKLNLVPSKN